MGRIWMPGFRRRGFESRRPANQPPQKAMTDYKVTRVDDDDEDPTYWCRRCLSLRVMSGGGCCDYCGDCGSCDIMSGKWGHYVIAKEERDRRREERRRGAQGR